MDKKFNEIINAILWGVGILLLLAAAFDVFPVADNMLVFLGLACFIIGGVIKRIAGKSS